MRIEFVEAASVRSPSAAAIFYAIEGEGLALAPDELAGTASAALESASRSEPKLGEEGKTLVVPGLAEIGRYAVLVGLGKRGAASLTAIEDTAGRALVAVADREPESIDVHMASFSAEEAAHAALGIALAAYRFDKYHTVKKKSGPDQIRVIVADPAAAAGAYEPLGAILKGIRLARDLTNEPPNVLFPATFVERLGVLAELGVEIEVLGEADMRARGMGSLLAVGQGSARESQFVICKWLGAEDKSAAPLVFVGKGVTFDSGGLSLKPTAGMELMKQDMGGAAAVVGALLALAERKAAANVIGLLGLVENMPDGDAFRVGDILTSMSGQTIEVVNTDAEGRLVLADALWFAQQEFSPRAMIDLATLTGHASYALGNDFSSLMSNDDALSGQLLDASAKEGENMWRLPLVAAYDKLHDTPHADMKNVGGHPEAGAITAALFLQRFVNKVPWAHLDIASVAWRTREDRATLPVGGTGYGVRTLYRLAADFYEDKA
jgi:leucyl aminopeptidase